jgi:hypothetical protein
MKFVSKYVLLLLVLVMASACSTALSSAGLSGDDAAMLSAALSIDPTTASLDFDYSVDLAISAEGDNIKVITSGRGITDPANGNSLLSMAGELSGIPDMGGATVPYDLEIRTLNSNDLYIRGLTGMIDPSMDPETWIFLDLATTTQMAMSSAPDLQSSGIMSNGQVDVGAVYSAINSNLFGSAGNYIEATRGDDMDGLAHYTVNLNIGDWMSSDELKSALETLIPLLAGDAVPAEELQANMQQMGFVLGMAGVVLKDGTYQFDYYVDPASGALARATIHLAIAVDPATMGSEGDPVTMDLVLDVNFNEFGAGSAVVAPENFFDPMGG